MATGATNGIPTARELENTGAFSFNTTNANVLSYVPSLDMCPTRQTILAAIKSGYGAEISTTYSNGRLVPYNAIQWQKNVGKLTISLLNTPPYSLNDYMMIAIKYSTNTSYLPSKYSDLNSLSNLSGALINTFTNTSVTIYFPSWSAYTQNIRIYYSWETFSTQSIYLYGNVTSAQLSSLKNGTNITITGYWTTNIG